MAVSNEQTVHPMITHIAEVLPHIAGHPEFIVAQREGYQVVDYNFAVDDSFDDPMRIECRGLKFDAAGTLIARPLHKFWNVGEKAATMPDQLDFAAPHVITTKLDGSMIHPAMVDGSVLLMTRMGHTDVAKKAEKRFLNETLESELAWALECDGVTPIFEFTAPDNRIVIRYDQPVLSLLAVRKTESGAYVASTDLPAWAERFGVPLVPHHSSGWSTGDSFIEYVRAIQGVEGFVVRFANGLWVKAKGDDYVLKHKAKDSILQEKNLLGLVLSGGLDDVLPLLNDDDRANAERYRDDVLDGISKTAGIVNNIVASGAALDQKAFAVSHLVGVPDHLRSLAFTVRQGKDAAMSVRAAIEKGLSSQSAVDQRRMLHGAVWAIDAVDEAA